LKGPSPCTSNDSSVPPKMTFIPLFTAGESGYDAVNEIYCVTNILHPPKRYFYFRFVCCPSRVHLHLKFCSFILCGSWCLRVLISLSFIRSFSLLCPSFVHSLCSGPSSGLYHLHLFFLKNVVYFLTHCLYFAFFILWSKVVSFFEGRLL